MVRRLPLLLALCVLFGAVAPLEADPVVVRPDFDHLRDPAHPGNPSGTNTSNDPGTATTTVPTAPAKRWWLRLPLEIALPVEGVGAVRATIVGFDNTTVPGVVGCRFDGPGKTASANPDRGVARLIFFGWLIPRPRSAMTMLGAVTRSGDCHFKLAVARQQPDGRWGQDEAVDAPAFEVAPHVRVVISETARMRQWLKPMHGPGCADDDREGKLAMRISTGAAGNDCRIDFLTAGNRNRNSDWNFNAIPEGVISGKVDWRTSGSSGVCALCDRVDGSACRGVGVPPNVIFPVDLIGPTIQEGGIGGEEAAMFVGPPGVPVHGNVVEPQAGVIIATNERGIWRSYGFTQYARMSCNSWAPSPAEVERTTREWYQDAADRIDAFGHELTDPLLPKGKGKGKGGPAKVPGPPPPPPTPSLWLVLHSWEFFKPAGTTLPWE